MLNSESCSIGLRSLVIGAVLRAGLSFGTLSWPDPALVPLVEIDES